jgi:hypothetical protein
VVAALDLANVSKHPVVEKLLDFVWVFWQGCELGGVKATWHKLRDS